MLILKPLFRVFGAYSHGITLTHLLLGTISTISTSMVLFTRVCLAIYLSVNRGYNLHAYQTSFKPLRRWVGTTIHKHSQTFAFKILLLFQVIIRVSVLTTKLRWHVNTRRIQFLGSMYISQLVLTFAVIYVCNLGYPAAGVLGRNGGRKDKTTSTGPFRTEQLIKSNK